MTLPSFSLFHSILNFQWKFWNLYKNTQFCKKKDAAEGVAPPPPIIFERLKLPQQIIYRRKGIFQRVWIITNIGEIFWFRDFMSNFREIVEF